MRQARVRVLVGGSVLGLVVGLVPVEPASGHLPSPTARLVRSSFFGLHDGDPTSWPKTSPGSLRLWDSGTSWRDLELRPGVFDLTRLDGIVAAAAKHRTRLTLVLGQTPEFHVAGAAALAGPVEYYGPGATRMPDLGSWRRYIRVLSRRYAGRVEALQVWNEPNVAGFWSGTPRQMARLTYWAAHEVRRVERRRHVRLRLVAPSFVARSNTAYLDRYWAQRVRGQRMDALVDAAALSLYPPRDEPPEASWRLLASVRRAVLDYRHVDLPLWNSEVNFGIAPGGPDGSPTRLDPESQASYVIRTYVLNAAAGVRRVFWYSWDQRGIASVVMSRQGQPTLAGHAFLRVQRWLAVGPLRGCDRKRDGRYVCLLGRTAPYARIVWNPHHVRRLTLPVGTRVTDLHGRTRVVSADAKLFVDDRPLLVRLPR